jgi:SAM-dependent methyltransferase
MALVDSYQPYGIRKFAQRLLPHPVRRGVKIALDQIQEATFMLHRVPPRSARLQISPAWFDFKKTGRDQMEFFTELTGLRPSERFLDIACGVGRLAIPLSRFLDSRGSYEGFDAHVPSIEWCLKQIADRQKNFNFQVADVKTDWSPERRFTSENYVFPYKDAEFDFAYAGSIFTHLTLAGAKNYLVQTARVMRPGARFVATWLIYNKNWASLMPGAMVDPAKHWPYDFGDHRIKDKDAPGLSVAYDVSAVRHLYDDANLTIVEPFRGDASYSPARIPSERQFGMHLYHALSIVAVKPCSSVSV